MMIEIDLDDYEMPDHSDVTVIVRGKFHGRTRELDPIINSAALYFHDVAKP